jgi:hypothetical protein
MGAEDGVTLTARKRVRSASPSPLASDDPDTFGHAKGGEAIGAAHGNGGFDLLVLG